MRLAGGSASASVNWAKSGLRCASSNPNGTIFPLNTVTLSRMPPLEYDAHPGVRCPPWYALPVLHVGFSSICWHLFWSNWGHKFHSIYPESITLHPARLAPTTEDFHSLHRSKVSKFDGIRLYARLFKTLEKPRFPPYSILSYSRGFYLRRRKRKGPLQVHFFLPI